MKGGGGTEVEMEMYSLEGLGWIRNGSSIGTILVSLQVVAFEKEVGEEWDEEWFLYPESEADLRIISSASMKKIEEKMNER